jgi:hypothetical protein
MGWTTLQVINTVSFWLLALIHRVEQICDLEAKWFEKAHRLVCYWSLPRNVSGQWHFTVKIPVRKECGRSARLLIYTDTPIQINSYTLILAAKAKNILSHTKNDYYINPWWWGVFIESYEIVVLRHQATVTFVPSLCCLHPLLLLVDSLTRRTP